MPTKILLLIIGTIITTNLYAETIYFGKHFRKVEIRKNATTLLLFPAAPLSSACQPGNAIALETLGRGSVSLIEKTQIQFSGGSKDGEDKPLHSRLKRMLRIKPNSKQSKQIRCTISLSSGREIGVDFYPRAGLVKPFIEFKPENEVLKDSPIIPGNFALEVLRASLRGKPISMMTEFDSRRKRRFRSSLEDDKKYERIFKTKLARYTVSYSGKSSKVNLFKLTVDPYRQVSFQKLSNLNVGASGIVLYSALFPQADSYKEDDRITHHIVTRADIDIREIERILP